MLWLFVVFYGGLIHTCRQDNWKWDFQLKQGASVTHGTASESIQLSFCSCFVLNPRVSRIRVRGKCLTSSWCENRLLRHSITSFEIMTWGRGNGKRRPPRRRRRSSGRKKLFTSGKRAVRVSERKRGRARRCLTGTRTLILRGDRNSEEGRPGPTRSEGSFKFLFRP